MYINYFILFLFLIFEFEQEHLKKFDKNNFKLFSIRAEEWGPLVFVNLDDDDYDHRITKQTLHQVGDDARAQKNKEKDKTKESIQYLKKEENRAKTKYRDAEDNDSEHAGK